MSDISTRVKKIIVEKENTTIIEGAGAADKVKDRIKLIKKQIEEAGGTVELK